MNKILREEMEYLIYCDDKAITPDVKDDVSLTLQYIDELEQRIDKTILDVNEELRKRIDKAIEYIKSPDICIDIRKDDGSKDFVSIEELLNILRGEE